MVVSFTVLTSLFGLAIILPVIIYHLYRFMEPLMEPQRKKSVAFFILASFFLAISGGCFAYFAGLPAALHFLTGFAIQNVSAMLTVESYLAFVVTYVLGFAALFQIPLILMIINSIKPIPPKKLMSLQRFVILGAFIAAAIISPTPDITNQAILAVPIILMYQVGVLLVWMQSRSARRKQRRAAPAVYAKSQQQPAPINQSAHSRPLIAATAIVPQQITSANRPAQRTRPVMDIAGPPRTVSRPAQPIRTTRPVQHDVIRRAPGLRAQSRPISGSRPASIDGIVRRQTLSQIS